jgi:hypothetical protein
VTFVSKEGALSAIESSMQVIMLGNTIEIVAFAGDNQHQDHVLKI